MVHDLAAHRAHRAQRDRDRLACTIGQAMLHATPEEHVDLRRLLDLVDADALPVDEAQKVAADVQRDQQARQAA